MNYRKQKAIEERHISRSISSKRTKWFDTRGVTTLEEVQKQINAWRYWEWGIDLREKLHRGYKNGAELYDLAIELENSPLMKALS